MTNTAEAAGAGSGEICAQALTVLYGRHVDPMAMLLAATSVAFLLAGHLAKADPATLPTSGPHVRSMLRTQLTNDAERSTWVVGHPQSGKIPYKLSTRTDGSASWRPASGVCLKGSGCVLWADHPIG